VSVGILFLTASVHFYASSLSFLRWATSYMPWCRPVFDWSLKSDEHGRHAEAVIGQCRGLCTPHDSVRFTHSAFQDENVIYLFCGTTCVGDPSQAMNVFPLKPRTKDGQIVESTKRQEVISVIVRCART